EQLPRRFSHVSIWALHLDNPVWSKDQGVEIVSAPSLDNVRLKNQSGKFTLFHTHFASLEEYVAECGSGVALTKISRPAAEAVPALPDLDSMGINSYHAYPDLGGLADLATMRLLLAELTAEGPGDGAPGVAAGSRRSARPPVHRRLQRGRRGLRAGRGVGDRLRLGPAALVG